MLNETVRKQIQQISLLHMSYSIIKDPRNTEGILDLSKRLEEFAKPEDIKKFAENLCVNRQAIEAIEKRYRVNNTDLEKLAKCKTGSLGKAYLAHLERNGISPEELPPPPVKDDLSYVRAHILETHDLWHVVTGYDASIKGELGLATFGAAQLPSQFEYLLVAGGILNTVFYNFDERDERMSAIAEGWVMGKKAKPLFGLKWNDHWNTPLTAVRKNLNIAV